MFTGDSLRHLPKIQSNFLKPTDQAAEVREIKKIKKNIQIKKIKERKKRPHRRTSRDGVRTIFCKKKKCYKKSCSNRGQKNQILSARVKKKKKKKKEEEQKHKTLNPKGRTPLFSFCLWYSAKVLPDCTCIRPQPSTSRLLLTF